MNNAIAETKANPSSDSVFVFRYGSESTIDRDVDAFESFFVNRYGEAAAVKIHERTVKNQKFLARALIVLGIATFVPKLVLRSESIFSITLIITGLMMLAYALYVYKKALKPYMATSQEIKQLVSEELSMARTKRNRIFDVSISDQGITTVHGVKTGMKQRHVKKWDEILCVDITDTLIFVKGITWFCRFQLGDDRFNQMASLLKENCGEVVNDERKRSA